MAARVHAEGMAQFDEEALWLRDERVAALLCDAPAVPLVVARRAGIPGCLLGNFTWADTWLALPPVYQQPTPFLRPAPGWRAAGCVLSKSERSQDGNHSTMGLSSLNWSGSQT